MQLITAALFLAASALAAPSEKRTDHETCTFGTYRCTHPNTGIEICNVANEWELVGDCPKDTACKNLDMGGYELPFCTDTVKVEARNGRGPSPGEKCEKAGQYQCFGAYAIQVCDTQNVLQFVGNCPERSHCEYLNGIPFCVASY